MRRRGPQDVQNIASNALSLKHLTFFIPFIFLTRS